jgi:hypothetical protein
MSKSELITRLNQLHDVVEVNNIGAVPSQMAAETLRLINPGLLQEMSEAIALDCDSRGRQQLTREDFARAGLTALQNTDVTDAIGIVKDLTARMRVAFRRRFLMYDAPANEPPPSLLENSRTVAMYRSLFDLSARDADGISRSELHRLVQVVLPEYPVDATNVCKAALSDRETDLIGFYEFMMVLQPTTSRRHLSDMLAIARRELADAKDDNFASLASGTDSQSRRLQGSTPDRVASTSLSATAVGQRPATRSADPKGATDRLRQELQGYQMQEAYADQRAQETLSSRATLATVPNVPKPPPPPKAEADEELTRRNLQLQLENEDLKRHNQTLLAELQSCEAQLNNNTRQRGRSASRAGSMAPGSSQQHDDVYDDDALRERHVKQPEEELRQARARLAIASETTELSALLRRSDNAHATVRNYYQDESVLVGKHRYLQEAVRPMLDGVSPMSTIVGQYDLLIVAYQGLYRQAKTKIDSEKAKSTFDPVSAARSIVPTSTPSVARVQRGSPSKTRSSPMRWKDLDREPTADMRGTGTLADPLLTDDERHTLRAKLAAQMRGGARYYDSRASSRSRARSPSASVSYAHPDSHAAGGVRGQMSSQATLSRLQSMTGRANRSRHLE